jgi:hypothetical protein
MSDLPPEAFPHDPAQRWGPLSSTASPQIPSAPPIAFARPARWPAFTALAIALIGVIVGVIGWFRPPPNNSRPPSAPKPVYTGQQVTDARASVCAAYRKVHHALELSSARNGGSDPNAILVVATSGRQVLDAGSRYLLAKLSDKPATPPDLTYAVRKLAIAYQELAIDYLADVSDSEMQPTFRDSDDATMTIERLCI